MKTTIRDLSHSCIKYNPVLVLKDVETNRIVEQETCLYMTQIQTDEDDDDDDDNDDKAIHSSFHCFAVSLMS